MKRSNRLVILVGVLLAVLAFVAILILLNQDGGGDGEPEAPVEVSVLVATDAIAIGDPVTPDLVEVQEVDPEAVIGTRLADPSQVSGQPALFAIPPGSQVSGEAIGLGNEGGINIAAMLQPGEKAVTFLVDRVTGVDFLVKPGDSIDIVMSQEVPAVQETLDSAANTDPDAQPRFEPVAGLENQRSVKAILQDKRVLYVSTTRAVAPEPTDTNGDGVIDENDPPPAEAESPETVIVVFAGTSSDAEIVKFAQGQDAALTAVIRSIEDDAIEVTEGVTLRRLVDELGVLVPDVIQLEFEAPE